MSDLFTVIVFYMVNLFDGWVSILNTKEHLQLHIEELFQRRTSIFKNLRQGSTK